MTLASVRHFCHGRLRFESGFSINGDMNSGLKCFERSDFDIRDMPTLSDVTEFIQRNPMTLSALLTLHIIFDLCQIPS